jgi:hypothetical protein
VTDGLGGSARTDSGSVPAMVSLQNLGDRKTAVAGKPHHLLARNDASSAVQ